MNKYEFGEIDYDTYVELSNVRAKKRLYDFKYLRLVLKNDIITLNKKTVQIVKNSGKKALLLRDRKSVV